MSPSSLLFYLLLISTIARNIHKHIIPACSIMSNAPQINIKIFMIIQNLVCVVLNHLCATVRHDKPLKDFCILVVFFIIIRTVYQFPAVAKVRHSIKNIVVQYSIKSLCKSGIIKAVMLLSISRNFIATVKRRPSKI